MNFACQVVVPGRAFLRCLCNATVGVHLPHLCNRVIREIKRDLLVFQEFLESLNGISFWREELHLKAELQVHSDEGLEFADIGAQRFDLKSGLQRVGLGI